MASIVANLALPIMVNGTKPSLKPTNFPVCALPERRGRVGVILRASSDGSDSSTSLNIMESVQNVWDKPEDRIAVIGLGFTAIIALWASLNLVAQNLPMIMLGSSTHYNMNIAVAFGDEEKDEEVIGIRREIDRKTIREIDRKTLRQRQSTSFL